MIGENMDLKVPIRDVLKKTGQKMNDLNCHFLIVSESVKLPAGINNLDRVRRLKSFSIVHIEKIESVHHDSSTTL